MFKKLMSKLNFKNQKSETIFETEIDIYKHNI